MTYWANMAEGSADTSGTALLQYPNAICTCIAAKDTNGPMFCAVQGEAGALYLDSIPIQCGKIRRVVGKAEEEYLVSDERDGHAYQMVELIRQLRDNDHESCRYLLDHTQNVMKVATALRHSASIWFPADGQEISGL